MKYTKEEIETAKLRLKEILKPGDTIGGIVRNVSRSGMSRVIDFYKIEGMEWLSGYMSIAMGLNMAKSDKGLKISGCGMDMIFATVSDLGFYLWPKGTPKAHGTRNGQPDFNGEYALKYTQI